MSTRKAIRTGGCRRRARGTLRAVCAATVLVAILAGCVTGASGAREGRDTGSDEAAIASGRDHAVLTDERVFVPGVHGGSIAVPLARGRAGSPSSFNPATSVWDEGETEINRLLFSAAVERDPLTGRFVPRLAESFTLSNDDRTITIRLREGLRWSDGEPLTADDFVYSFESVYLDPELSIYGGLVEPKVGTITVSTERPDEFSITFERRHPSVWTFISLPPLPRHVVEPWLGANGAGAFLEYWSAFDDLDDHVGSGPFVLADHVLDTSVRLERNPYYYECDAEGNRLPYLDGITLIVVDDSDPLELYAEGTIDLVGIMTPVGEQTLADVRINDEHFVAMSAYATGAEGNRSFIDFNQNIPTEENPLGLDAPAVRWFRNDAFRRALGHLIDRDALNELVFAGRGEPVRTAEPVESPYATEPEGIVPRYDPARANAILDELGWVDTDDDGVREDDDGNPLSFSIATNPRPARELLAGAVAVQLREGGLDARAHIEDFTSLVARISGTGDYEAFLLGSSWSVDWTFQYGYRDYTGFSRRNDDRPNATLELLNTVVDRLDDTVDPGAFTRLVTTAETLLCLQADSIWLLQSPSYWALRRPYGNLVPRVGDFRMFSYERVFILNATE